MKIIIVGGGNNVYFLTKIFISKGYNVTIINSDKEECVKLARIYNIVTVNGDATKPYILEDAGVAYTDLVIALTSKDQSNLVICQLAEKIFKVSRTFAVVNDPNNVDIFKELGVDTVISTTDIISSLIEQRISIEDIINLIPMEEGKVINLEVEILEDSPVINNKLKDLSMPEDSTIGCIIRNDKPVIPNGDTIILLNDKLIIICLPKVQSNVLKSITGRIE